MPSARILPRSLVLFAIGAVVYGLQAIPVTGIFLMVLLAPLWNGMVFVLGLGALAVEAAIGATSRLWLILPLGCALLYGQAAWQSRTEADALVAAAAHVNDGKTLAFDPDRAALVIEGSDGASELGDLLVAYDLPAYWTVDPRNRTATPILHRLAVGEVCDRVRTDRSFAAANIRVLGVHERQSGRSVFLKGVCSLALPAPIVGTPVTVALGRRDGAPTDPARRWSRTITLRSGADEIALHLGGISPLPWMPFPTIGCALNSGAPSWDCFARFRREKERRIGAASAEAAVVAALGLTPAPASTRLDRIAARPLPDFGPVVAARETTALAALDAALADPKKRVTVHDLAGLAAHPDVWTDRIPALVAAIGRRLAEAKAERETQRNFADLLANLPRDRLAAVLPDLLDIWSRVPAGRLDLDVVPASMVARLAEFGAPALPIVERLAFDAPRTWIGAPMRALCRLAPLSARDADAVAARLAGRDRREEFDAAVVTLLRLGRRDLVAPILDADFAAEDRHTEERRASLAGRIVDLVPGRTADVARRIFEAIPPRRKKLEQWLATVTPASPPEVCAAK
jgi:hypothetical protein